MSLNFIHLYIFKGKGPSHRRVKDKRSDIGSANNTEEMSSNNAEPPKSVGFKPNSFPIDDRTITRRTKGSSQRDDQYITQSEAVDDSTQCPTYRAQSAKDRGTSRYQIMISAKFC
jgi:hypothetical protein